MKFNNESIIVVHMLIDKLRDSVDVDDLVLEEIDKPNYALWMFVFGASLIVFFNVWNFVYG